MTALPMTNQSTPTSDGDIWDELLHSDASKQFLDRLLKELKEVQEILQPPAQTH